MNPKLLLGLALVLSGGLSGCSTGIKPAGLKSVCWPAPLNGMDFYQGWDWFPVPGQEYPLSVEEIQRIDEMLPKLKPGMTGAEVKTILNQTALNRIEWIYGSGPMHDYRFYYQLAPGYGLMMVEDLTSQPDKFVRYVKGGVGWLKP